MDALWTTVATVVPVLALAVVLEIRAYGARWLEQPVWIRTLQAVLWIVFFIGASIVMLGVLRALRHDPARPTPDWLADLSINVVAMGIGVLILAPAIELILRVALPLLAFLRSAHPKIAFKAWYLYVQARASQRTYSLLSSQATQLEARGSQVLAEREEQLQKNAAGIRAARTELSRLREDDPTRPAIVEYLERAEQWERETQDYIAEGKWILSQRPPNADKHFESLVVETKKLKEEIASLSSDERRDFERLFKSIPIGLNPLIPPMPPTRREGKAVHRVPSRPSSSSVRQQKAAPRSRAWRVWRVSSRR